VVSCLRPDADISGIYSEGVAELEAVDPERIFGATGRHFAELQRAFLNDAARLLEMEEAGEFRFWAPEVLVSMVRRAGFSDVRATLAFGMPPQAVAVVAERR
jgi:hypothetical protein